MTTGRINQVASLARERRLLPGEYRIAAEWYVNTKLTAYTRPSLLTA